MAPVLSVLCVNVCACDCLFEGSLIFQHGNMCQGNFGVCEKKNEMVWPHLEGEEFVKKSVFEQD